MQNFKPKTEREEGVKVRTRFTLAEELYTELAFSTKHKPSFCGNTKVRKRSFFSFLEKLKIVNPKGRICVCEREIRHQQAVSVKDFRVQQRGVTDRVFDNLKNKG